MIELVVALIFGILGGYIGKTCEQFVKCFTTAFIGSFFFANGISFYLNNYPSFEINKDQTQDKIDPWVYAYFGT